MTWNRRSSRLELLMVAVLKNGKLLTLNQIVEEIVAMENSAFMGKTPKNSLYSIITRTEKRRLERGQNKLFKTTAKDGRIYYSLNSGIENI